MKLSGNSLKIIGAIAMLFDHVGLLFFTNILIFRVIGRLAFPIFAYFIAEGTRYTKNKLRYFLQIFTTAALCQVVDFVASNRVYMCTLVTFSISILVIYSLQFLKKTLINKSKLAFLAFFVFLCSLLATWQVNTIFEIDYGFFGCMLPVFVSLFQPVTKGEKNSNLLNCAMLTIGLILLSVNIMWIQYFSLLSVPLLLCYSGNKGKYNMKYFFYVFYPVHLGILGLIDMLRW